MTNPPLAAFGLPRFGLGVRPGDLDRIGPDLRARLDAEIRRGAARYPDGDLLDGPTGLTLLREQDERIRIAREAVKAPPADGAAPPPQPMLAPTAEPPVAQRLFMMEAKARLGLALSEPIGFTERLVWFWSNHFAISVAKGNNVRALAGAFEREAVRPHVTGRFADLLLAVETHPAMIYYLDNQASIGPNSGAGKARGRGLNENLGREILELHTLGVEGGYTQADVTALAGILTGWTVVGPEGKLGRPGTAAFVPYNHEPGPIRLLGRSYPDYGPEQFRTALGDIARHPSTALFIARKLARHFVADLPPQTLVDRMAAAFRDSDGDLARVYGVLLDAPEAWTVERPKMRSPAEYLVAAARLLQPPGDATGPLLNGLTLLGQPLWAPHEPNGFGDRVDDWASAEGLKVRLDLAARAAQRPPNAEPAALLDGLFGSAVSRDTREAVMRAESRSQAVALLLMSPEFQRR